MQHRNGTNPKPNPTHNEKCSHSAVLNPNGECKKLSLNHNAVPNPNGDHKELSRSHNAKLLHPNSQRGKGRRALLKRALTQK